MRFGYFLAPYHTLGENPTLALERDLDLFVLLDRLGFDEAWCGEHHSAGHEIIGSPEIFLAAAAERTRHIRLGTGVISLPFHHPFHVADRMVLLDHLTRGRVMLGCGPGQLASDAHMLGIDPFSIRSRLVEALGVVRALLDGETVTHTTDWFTLRDARLQLRPYQERLEMAVTGTVTTNGALAAGEHGMGLLSVAATTPMGYAALRDHWDAYETSAAQHGQVADRGAWRLVGPMHLAETREQALRDVEHGILSFSNYFHHVGPGGIWQGSTVPEVLASNEERQTAIIGTPEDAIERIEQILEHCGGAGTFVLLGHEWARPEETRRSLELFAQYVIPHFNGQLAPPRASSAWVDERAATFAETNAAAMAKHTIAGASASTP